MDSRTIVLKGTGVRQEGIADGAVTPGMLVSLTSAGKITKHATAGGIAAKCFAVENDLMGDGVSTDYADGKLVQANTMLPGDEVNAILATSQTINKGDLLESAGTGYLRAITAFSQLGGSPYTVTPAGYPIARAKEAVTTTGSVARIAVEIL